MKKHILSSAVISLGLSAMAVHGASIAVFDNPNYTDSAGSGSSAKSLEALLSAQGHDVFTFSGFSATDFVGASSKGIILIPDFNETSNLKEDMPPEAKGAIAQLVQSGVGLIGIGWGGYNFLNFTLYDDQFASTSTTGPSTKRAGDAAGTAYVNAPEILDQAQGAINPYAFTPAGARLLYEDKDQGVTVLTAPYGNGTYAFLGWNFQNAIPNGTMDGGWADVLQKSIVAVPEPGTYALAAFGGLLLIWSKQRRR
jgi:hypothetical protein